MTRLTTAAALLLALATPAAAQNVSVERQAAFAAAQAELPVPQSERIEKKRDSIWNGVAIGAAAGFGGGFALVLTSGGCDCYDAGAWMKVTAPAILIGAAAGAAIDAAIPGGVTVYKSKTGTTKATIAPAFSKGAGGARMSIAF